MEKTVFFIVSSRSLRGNLTFVIRGELNLRFDFFTSLSPGFFYRLTPNFQRKRMALLKKSTGSSVCFAPKVLSSSTFLYRTHLLYDKSSALH